MQRVHRRRIQRKLFSHTEKTNFQLLHPVWTGISELRKDEPFELRDSRTFRIILSSDEDGHSYYSCPHLVPRSYSVLIDRGRSGYEIIHALGKRERMEQLHDDVILLQLLYQKP